MCVCVCVWVSLTRWQHQTQQQHVAGCLCCCCSHCYVAAFSCLHLASSLLSSPAPQLLSSPVAFCIVISPLITLRPHLVWLVLVSFRSIRFDSTRLDSIIGIGSRRLFTSCCHNEAIWPCCWCGCDCGCGFYSCCYYSELFLTFLLPSSVGRLYSGSSRWLPLFDFAINHWQTNVWHLIEYVKTITIKL